MSAQPNPKVIVLDEGRQTSLASVGRNEDTQYLVEERADGSLLLVPAAEVSELELAVLRNPELLAILEAAAPGRPRPPLIDLGSFAQYADDDLDDEERASSGG